MSVWEFLAFFALGIVLSVVSTWLGWGFWPTVVLGFLLGFLGGLVFLR